MIKKANIRNRPVSPHLVIYSAQLSSLFSIWHRITGVTLSGIFVFLGLVVKKSLTHHKLCFIDIMFCADFIYAFWFNGFLFSLSLLAFSYHFLNGCRHVAWDVGHLLNVKNLDTSSFILAILVTAILALNLL
nr:succinate:cytochrome c oxidoreductase subunit 3 [Gloiopeltis furcata]